jgi:MFS family permease
MQILCRGKFMVGLAAFWMVGSLYSAGMGWAMIPTVGWRAFLVVAALPAFAAASGCLLLLPESPRHLLVHGKVGPAEKVGAVACADTCWLQCQYVGRSVL